MKKVICIFMMLFVASMSVNANDVVKSIASSSKQSVETLYTDGKNVIDTLYKDGKEVVSTLYGDGKEGFSNLYPDIKSAISSIAKGVGVAVEHVYGVLVKKYFVVGIKEAMFMVFAIILLIFSSVWLKQILQETKLKGEPITYRIVFPLVLFIIGMIKLLTINYDDMLMGIINPEYGAINYILEYAKQITN